MDAPRFYGFLTRNTRRSTHTVYGSAAACVVSGITGVLNVGGESAILTQDGGLTLPTMAAKGEHLHRVLVVDDEESLRKLLRRMLVRSGYSVDTAPNGVEALASAQKDRPDLIISDILMPVMDGFALCRRCKSDATLRDIPFVFCTGSFTHRHDRDLAVTLGADAFVTKPLVMSEFLSTVERMLNRQAVSQPSASAAQGMEDAFLEEYSRALVRKLEHKMVQVEDANRSLQAALAEREQAETEVRRQLAELQVIHSIAAAGATATKTADLVCQVSRRAANALDAQCVHIWLIDASGTSLVRQVSGKDAGGRQPVAVSVDEGLLGQVVRDGQPHRYRRVGDGEQQSELPQAPWAESGLCVPISDGTRVRGVACALAAGRSAYDEKHEHFLGICADQLAMALGRLDLTELLEERIRDRSRELSALYDVTALANEQLPLGQMLGRPLAKVMGALESEEGFIHLLSEQGETLRLGAKQGIDDELAALLDTVPASEGVMGWLVHAAEPLAVGDLGADQRTPAEHRRLLAGRAYLGAPIRGIGTVLGTISLTGEAGKAFNLEGIALLASIADHVGVAVENAFLRRRVELAAAMEERQRLARELHDSAVQSLYAVSLLAEGGRRLARGGALMGDDLDDYLVDLRDTSQQALKELRLLVYELRPPALAKEGLAGALQHRLEAVEKRARIDASLVVTGDAKVASETEFELYRVAQEALNNTLKHATAKNVRVRIEKGPEEYVLSIEDDGDGFQYSSHHSAGLGLVSMKERVERLGGHLTIESQTGHGTKVTVKLRDAAGGRHSPTPWALGEFIDLEQNT